MTLYNITGFRTISRVSAAIIKTSETDSTTQHLSWQEGWAGSALSKVFAFKCKTRNGYCCRIRTSKEIDIYIYKRSVIFAIQCCHVLTGSLSYSQIALSSYLSFMRKKLDFDCSGVSMYSVPQRQRDSPSFNS